MHLKKAKLLVQTQMTNILNNVVDIVEDLDKIRNNEQLKERLEEIKTNSDEILNYFIDNCKEEAKKIKEMNERHNKKRPSLDEAMNNEKTKP